MPDSEPNGTQQKQPAAVNFGCEQIRSFCQKIEGVALWQRYQPVPKSALSKRRRGKATQNMKTATYPRGRWGRPRKHALHELQVETRQKRPACSEFRRIEMRQRTLATVLGNYRRGIVTDCFPANVCRRARGHDIVNHENTGAAPSAHLHVACA